MTRPSFPALRALALLSVLGLGACTSLDRFDTKGKAAYCGSLVASPVFEEGLLPKGRPRSLQLGLSLDIGTLTSRGDESLIVGRLSSDDRDRGLCSAAGQPLFDAAPLRTMPALDHDLLSTLDFGSGRDYSFFSWVDSSCQGTLLAVVSLMRNEDVEVRLFKPAALPAPGAGPELQPGFGLFTLQRRDAGCSF
ncbi:MAG TPA: hypothetical protein VG937_19685 [Polyangiaceae bacterium]|jgi:hypothetical protein|nr:hypothetical protein [Polyangiaceae bacterium]